MAAPTKKYHVVTNEKDSSLIVTFPLKSSIGSTTLNNIEGVEAVKAVPNPKLVDISSVLSRNSHFIYYKVFVHPCYNVNDVVSDIISLCEGEE